jgi:hypothetical protein
MKANRKVHVLLALGVATLAIFLGGCVVQSVYPFFTAKDVVFDAALLGTWSENGAADDKESWTIQKLGDKAYRSIFLKTTIAESNRFETHLFQLKEQRFLDLCATERLEGHLPLHYVFKVEQIQPTLKVSVISDDWLKKLLEKNPQAVRHLRVPKQPDATNRYDVILTGDTKELQELLLKYSNDTNAFGEPIEWKRRK